MGPFSRTADRILLTGLLQITGSIFKTTDDLLMKYQTTSRTEIMETDPTMDCTKIKMELCQLLGFFLNRM